MVTTPTRAKQIALQRGGQHPGTLVNISGIHKSKLSTEMLAKIADVLEVSPMDIMTQQPAIINFQPNQGTQQAFGHVDTFVSTQKELFEKLLEAKDAEIKRMQEVIESLLKK